MPPEAVILGEEDRKEAKRKPTSLQEALQILKADTQGIQTWKG